MPTATMTGKGQITLPQSVRQTLGPQPISLVMLAECCWILKRLYRASPVDLLDIRQLAVEQRTVVAAALSRLGSGAGDIADALTVEIANRSGCGRIVTFDKSAGRLGMTGLS